jgi:type I restriction enzyme, S subunit
VTATASKLTLLDVCEAIVDCEHKTAPTQETGYPSIRTPNIGRGRLLLDGVNRVSEETYRLWTQRAIPQAGDLILAREAPIGNVAMIPLKVDVCLGQRTVLIRPNKQKVNSIFLTYLLLGDEMQNRIRSMSNGSTVHHLNMKDIRGLCLPELPPLETQHKIATILSSYDDLIENNTRRIEILEDMARGLYREWFVNFRFPGHEEVEMVDSGTRLGNVPSGWSVVKLQDRIELAYGKALKAEDRVPGEFPVYGSSGVVGTHAESLVDGPGIILGRKGNVGSVHWSEEAFFPIDTVYFVRTDLSLFYTFYNLRDQHFLNNDAAVPGLNRNQAYSLPLLLPEPSLIGRFDEFCEPLFVKLRNLRARNNNLRRTRDLLLPKLISGEIDVSTLEIAGVTGSETAIESV